MRTLHFISGLPRSGSTLLAAILRQNPEITAAMSSPVCQMMRRMMYTMSGGEFSMFFTRERRETVLRFMLDGFHHDARAHIVDTNRFWTAHMELLANLYPFSRVICCVRNLGWIINSVENAIRKHPDRVSGMFGFRTDGTVYTRAGQLMDDHKGMLGRSYGSLKQAWFGPHADKLIVVDYDHLVTDPAGIVSALYERCGWPAFQHDFSNVEYDEPEFDEKLGTPGLHRVSGPVRRQTSKLTIPPDLFSRYSDSAFWLNPEANMRGVEVLIPGKRIAKAAG